MATYHQDLHNLSRADEYRLARKNRLLILRSKLMKKVPTRVAPSNTASFVPISGRPSQLLSSRFVQNSEHDTIFINTRLIAKYRQARMVRRFKLNTKRQAKQLSQAKSGHLCATAGTQAGPTVHPPPAPRCTCKVCLASPPLHVNDASDLGEPTCTCSFCGASFWYEERTQRTSTQAIQYFYLCCMQGKVQLPDLPHPPNELAQLLHTLSRTATAFRKSIRAYNSMFAFTSMGGNIDHNTNRGKVPYVFRLNGQNIHRIGSLLPTEGKQPAFAQLYIYDTENETRNRIRAVKGDATDAIDTAIVQSLKAMVDNHNTLAQF